MTTHDRAFDRARECINEVRLAFAHDDNRVAMAAVCDALERYDAWWDAETGGPSPFHDAPSPARMATT